MGYTETLIVEFMRELEKEIPDKDKRELKAIALTRIAYRTFENLVEFAEYTGQSRRAKSWLTKNN